MSRKNKHIDSIPEEFSNYEEAAEFWDTHDTTDYPEAFQDIEVKAKFRKRHYELEVDEDIMNVLPIKFYEVKSQKSPSFYNNVPEIPAQFHLFQNYPNPFNPSTTIRYTLPKSEFVTLKVYDILSQEVRTLANGKQAAGIKSLLWDGRDNTGKAVSSGIYIYRLHAADYVKNRKMVLIR
jgi:hypothetical protein